MNFQLERQETKALNFVGGGTFGGVHLYGDRKWNRSRFVGFEPSSCGICSDVFLIFVCFGFLKEGFEGGQSDVRFKKLQNKLQINSSPLKDDAWKMTFSLK